MSPRICIESFIDPIQLALWTGVGGVTSATGFPRRVILSGCLVFWTSSSNAKHFALNSEIATSLMVISLDHSHLERSIKWVIGRLESIRAQSCSIHLKFRGERADVWAATTPSSGRRRLGAVRGGPEREMRTPEPLHLMKQGGCKRLGSKGIPWPRHRRPDTCCECGSC